VRAGPLRMFFCVLVVASAAIALTIDVAERIDIVAIEDTDLVDLRGTNTEMPRVVGVLKAGQVARVIRCRPHKTDIAIEVRVGDKVAGVWGANFETRRRPATFIDRLTDDDVTSSCLGML